MGDPYQQDSRAGEEKEQEKIPLQPARGFYQNRWFFLGGSALILVIALFLYLFLTPRPLPNLLIVVLDTVRADCVGAQWKKRSLTPNIDMLSRNGTTFSSALSAAPWTLPSHASLFTGLYPYQHRAVHGRFYLDSSLTTLAETLQERGYETGCFTCNPWLLEKNGMAQGFETFKGIFKHTKPGPDKGAAEATSLLMEWVEKRPKEKPFFLFVNYMEAHLPYVPPEAVLNRLEISIPDPADRSFTIEEAERCITGDSPLSPDKLEQVKSLYYSEVAYLDDTVGTLVEGLQRNDCLDDTILILTSDHGEHLGEHGLTGHEFSVYDALLRVPLIFRYPEIFPPGKRIGLPVSLLDVSPTILEIVGEEPSPAIQGRSLLHALSETAQDRPLLAEYSKPVLLINKSWPKKYPHFDISPFDVGLKALRKGDFKYISTSRGEEALYHLGVDPEEKMDLSATKTEELRSLRREMREILRSQ